MTIAPNGEAGKVFLSRFPLLFGKKKKTTGKKKERPRPGMEGDGRERGGIFNYTMLFKKKH